MAQKQKVIVYIDGFNFYYGLKRKPAWKKYYWLNVVKLFEMFMHPNQELVAVKYFSARSLNAEQGKRQNAFFQANQENPKFNLILGKYLKKQIICRNCQHTIYSYEEKESDVRLATQIVADAYQKNCDISILVSADSDMIPAIELALAAKQKIFIYFPPHQYSNNLNTLHKQSKTAQPIHMKHYKSRFRQCVFPDKVHLSRTNFNLTIPEKWKSFQR